MSYAQQNMIAALPFDGGFFADLAVKVKNSGDQEGAAAWALGFVGSWLESKGQPSHPIASYDFAILEIEYLDQIWPAFRFAANNLPVAAPLGDIAEFLFRRLPHAWDNAKPRCIAPVTEAVHLADKIDDLVSHFAVGNAPTGSKDPYAVRRSANQILNDRVLPLRSVTFRSNPD